MEKPIDDFVFYRRRLPHIQPNQATFFITTRLAGSLPNHVVKTLQEEQEYWHRRVELTTDKNEKQKLAHELGKRYFGEFDEYVNRASTGPMWLRMPEIAEVVTEALHFRDGKVYDLCCYTIMPNHLHLVISVLRNDISLYRLLQSLKRHTSREGNKILKRTGAFWHHESYDHVVRDERELERILQYVLLNPVKAGLCKSWTEWKWSYIKPDLVVFD